MNDTTKTILTANHPYRDYSVYLQIDDDDRQYLLQIGHVHEREAGILSGDTLHGTLVLKRAHCQASDHRESATPSWPTCPVSVPHSNYYPHA